MQYFGVAGAAHFATAMWLAFLTRFAPAIVIGMTLASSAVSQDRESRPISIEESPLAITVRVREQEVLRYQKALKESPEGIAALYHRSGYIHPICSPSGRQVTGDFSPDHAHQHAFFLAWVKTRFDGRAVDFWNQHKNTGRVSHESVEAVEVGREFVEFSVSLLHQDISDPQFPIAVLRETWNVRVYDRDDLNVFDFRSEQTNIANAPLELAKHHYGGLGIRGNNRWRKDAAENAMKEWRSAIAAANEGAKATQEQMPPGMEIMGHAFLTSEGKTRIDGNQCDYIRRCRIFHFRQWLLVNSKSSRGKLMLLAFE